MVTKKAVTIMLAYLQAHGVILMTDATPDAWVDYLNNRGIQDLNDRELMPAARSAIENATRPDQLANPRINAEHISQQILHLREVRRRDARAWHIYPEGLGDYPDLENRWRKTLCHYIGIGATVEDAERLAWRAINQEPPKLLPISPEANQALAKLRTQLAHTPQKGDKNTAQSA